MEGFVGVPVKEFGRASGFKRYCERCKERGIFKICRDSDRR